MEREEVLNDKDAVEPSGGVRATGVEVLLVGGRLNVKRELGKGLDVCCESRDKLCYVQFYRGKSPLASGRV